MKTWILKILGRFESLWFRDDAIYVPVVRMGIGGPRSFMQLLIRAAKSQGQRVTHNRFARAKAAIIAIAMDPTALRDWKQCNPNAHIIQRLDGVFYDPQKSDYDRVRNADLETVYHELADTIVFQSEYSRLQCEHFLGKSKHAKQSCVILNGTDLQRFVPSSKGDSTGKDRIRFITVGNFRDPEMLKPILIALDALDREFELEIAGPIQTEFLAMVKSRPYARTLGPLNHEALAERLGAADVFLFSFLNPNCPNAVIEAIAAGLPVVSFDSGAMRELCEFNLELLAPVKAIDPVIHKRSEIVSSADGFRTALQRCLEDLPTLRQRTLLARDRFDIDLAVKAYLQLID